MDKATLIGLITALILIAGAMLFGGSILMFINVPSILIVFGGTFAATLVTENLKNVLYAWKIGLVACVERASPVEEALERIVRISQIARSNGVLAIENEKMDNPFFDKALRLVCGGMPADELAATLESEVVALKSRHDRGQAMFKFMSGTAPSMGMIGTLIGLVQMLQTLDDPSAIGPSMAVALLTTLYGAVLAFVVCTPIAEKLKLRTREEIRNMRIGIQGFVCIAKGDNPLIIREKLNAFLAPVERKPEDQPA